MSKAEIGESLDKHNTPYDVILHLMEWWKYLVSKLILVFIICLIGAVLGLLYSFYKKPIYNATCTFVLEDGGGAGSAIGQYAGIASMVGIDLSSGGGLFQGDNIIELYKSRKMIEETLLSKIIYNGKEELLIDHYIKFRELRKLWNDKPELRDLNFYNNSIRPFSRIQDSVIGKMVETINNENLSVSRPDKKLSIIKVEVKSVDEFFAKSFNDLIVKNVNDFYVQTKTIKSLQNVNILKHQTDSVRDELNASIRGVASSSDAVPNANPSRLILRTPSQRKQFDAQANQAILTELVKNLEISKVSLRKETPLIQVIDKPVFPLENDRLKKLKACIIGAFLSGLLIIGYLSIKFFLKNIRDKINTLQTAS